MSEAIQKLIDEEGAEREQRGVVSTLSSLVKDGILTLAAAAKRAGMTEDAFKKMAML